MKAEIEKDYQRSIEFWNEAFKPYAEGEAEKEDLKEIAPSEKLYQACVSLGALENVLDYGCGHGWASVIMASSGCRNVHAVDVNESAPKAAKKLAEAYGVQDRVKTEFVPVSWIGSEKEEKYDGFFCSNVLDVIPTEASDRIIREAARILKKGGRVVIGLNYYMVPAENPERKMTVKEGNHVYIDGILRLVTRTDEEWTEAFSPYFQVDRVEHFAWPNEQTERRRLFCLTKKDEQICSQTAL